MKTDVWSNGREYNDEQTERDAGAREARGLVPGMGLNRKRGNASRQRQNVLSNHRVEIKKWVQKQRSSKRNNEKQRRSSVSVLRRTTMAQQDCQVKWRGAGSQRLDDIGTVSVRYGRRVGTVRRLISVPLFRIQFRWPPSMPVR
jgi:hypothetical protein